MTFWIYIFWGDVKYWMNEWMNISFGKEGCRNWGEANRMEKWKTGNRVNEEATWPIIWTLKLEICKRYVQRFLSPCLLYWNLNLPFLTKNEFMLTIQDQVFPLVTPSMQTKQTNIQNARFYCWIGTLFWFMQKVLRSKNCQFYVY